MDMVETSKVFIKALETVLTKDIPTVMATVVQSDVPELLAEGSRQLLMSKHPSFGNMTGIEDELLCKEAKSVFKTRRTKMAKYTVKGHDVWVLLELFLPERDLEPAFYKQINLKRNFEVISFYHKSEGEEERLRSIISLAEGIYTFSGKPLIIDNSQLSIYKQEIQMG